MPEKLWLWREEDVVKDIFKRLFGKASVQAPLIDSCGCLETKNI